MKKFFSNLSLIIILASCSNTTDMETGEIKTLQLVKRAFSSSNKPEQFIDAKKSITRAN